MPVETTPAAGDVVWIRKRRWRVSRLRLSGRVGILDVVLAGDASVRRTFLTPFDRAWPEGGRERLRHVRWPRARARLLGLAARAGALRVPLSAIDARVQILPFQLEAALAFLHGARRVLIADDVGLGKTVQAGLVVAEVVRRTADACVLILVPASLRDQWTAELAARLGITATSADAWTLHRLALDAPRGTTPWRPGVWIGSADFLKQPHVFDGLPPWPWDLVVVDEAHDAAGESDRHAACDAIARRSRRVLLLTATPHNGDAAAFDRLRSVGRSPELAAGPDRLVILRRTPAALGWSSTRRVRWHRVAPTPAERAALDALLAFERVVLGAAGQGHRGAAVLLLAVLRKRALSTMAALAASLTRRVAWLDASAAIDADPAGWHQPLLAFDATRDDALAASEDAALAADVGLERSREHAWVRRLAALAERAALHESRVRRVVALVARSREPAVVFTEFRDSLTALTGPVARVATVAVLHGGLSADERRAALRAYLDGPATVLVATDVAGQGLNLQARGRWVVNLDLPWNPARLAQRAGRVDRIGQTRAVHITLLSSRHDAEAGLIRRLAERSMRASDAIGLGWDGLGWPDEQAVGAALVAGADLAPRRPPVVALDVSWRRHARWVARDVLRRRSWTAQWRDDDLGSSRPLLARRRFAGANAAAAAAGWILIFSTPIVDQTGAVLETHLGACRVRTTGGRRPTRSVVDRARQVAARQAQRRADRVRRLMAARSQTTATVEAAIANELRRARLARLPQPGLFDRRRPDAARPPSQGFDGTTTPSAHRVSTGRAVLVAAIATGGGR